MSAVADTLRVSANGGLLASGMASPRPIRGMPAPIVKGVILPIACTIGNTPNRHELPQIGQLASRHLPWSEGLSRGHTALVLTRGF